MTIFIDTREKPKAIERILDYFKAKDIQYATTKLFVGDYMSLDNPRLIIDRKQNLGELAFNVSSVPKKAAGKIKRDEHGHPVTEWKRFTSELGKARDMGIQIVILCEHGNGITKLEDVQLWVNPRLQESPLTITGDELYRKLLLLKNEYGVRFEFCHKGQTGRRIVEILKESDNAP